MVPHTFQGRKALRILRAVWGRKPTCNISCWSHLFYIRLININWTEDKHFSLDYTPLSKETLVFQSCLLLLPELQWSEDRTAGLSSAVSSPSQQSAQPLGQRASSGWRVPLAGGTCSCTMQCQTAAKGGWRRASACGTPWTTAKALTPAIEYMGRKERGNLLFPLWEMQEECRERYKC